jgi:DNA-binding transcriptional ArsR family regulator
MEQNVTLDKASFKALAVETRVDILKVLHSRQHTQTEIAELLELSVPTVKEHLDALVLAQLVERKDEGRKWVYYALTKKGKALLNPEEAKFWIVLGTLALTAGGVVTGMIRTRYASLYAPGVADTAASAAAPMVASAKQVAVETIAENAPTLADTAQASIAEAAVDGARAVADVAPQLMAAPLKQSADEAALGALQATNVSPLAGADAGSQIPWGWIIIGAIVLGQLCLLGHFWHKSRKQKKQWDTLGIKH